MEAQVGKPDFDNSAYLVSDDPVGANLPALAEAYRAAGLTRVEMRVYPGARHETLNETNRDEVTAALLRWVDTVLAGA